MKKSHRSLAAVLSVIALVGCSDGERSILNMPKEFVCVPSPAVLVADATKSNGSGGGSLSNAEFIYFSYLTILDRRPDASGFKAQCDALSKGVSRAQLTDSLVDSAEFKARLTSKSDNKK